MSIRWDFRPPGATAPRIPVQVWYIPKHHTKARPAFVRLLGACASVWMHWDPVNRNRSTPCHTENCPFCPARSFRSAFAPALLWMRNSGNNQEGWVTIVAGFPDQVLDSIGYGKGRGIMLSFWRDSVHSGSKICWEVLETGIKEQLDPAFDVAPPLERVWGFQQRQRELAKRQQEEAWRGDLNEVLKDAPQAAAQPPVAPPPVSPAPPPRPSPAKPAPSTNGRPLPKFAELRAKRGEKAVILPLTSTVEAAEASDLADVPAPAPASAKRPRRSRKGGA